MSKLTQLALDLAVYASKHKRFVNKRNLASFVGTAISLSPAILGGRFHLLPLYDSLHLNSSWSHSAVVRLTNSAYR